jgi:hypothetical protein
MTDRVDERCEIIECASAAEFLERLSIHSAPFNSAKRDWMFRGLGRSTFPLLPTALRPLRDRGDDTCELDRFVKRAPGPLTNRT